MRSERGERGEGVRGGRGKPGWGAGGKRKEGNQLNDTRETTIPAEMYMYTLACTYVLLYMCITHT